MERTYYFLLALSYGHNTRQRLLQLGLTDRDISYVVSTARSLRVEFDQEGDWFKLTNWGALDGNWLHKNAKSIAKTLHLKEIQTIEHAERPTKEGEVEPAETNGVELPFFTFADSTHLIQGWYAIRTTDMADDEHWFGFFDSGKWYSYGSFCGLKLRREIQGVRAWRKLSSAETKAMAEGKYN